MRYSVVKPHERVRTTISLSSDLLQRSQRFIDDGTAPNRTALIEAALEHLLDELERLQIDRQFEAMADDTAYHSLNESIAEEFSESDWEAFLLVESQEKP
jgi:metal-responsive CopG/Arc/MetJ family transcriptional regulator